MTSAREPLVVGKGSYVFLVVAGLVTLPGMYLGITHLTVAPVLGAIVFGVAIFGAAFILSWAAEAAEIDISESLAVAILALVAVLPEYAVDFVFTWKAGQEGIGGPSTHYAIANMTGANRLLVGVGWPAVLFVYVWARKKQELILDESQKVEIFYLAMATLYSFTIPLKGSLNLIDMVILVSIFVMYTRRIAQMPVVEPEFVGPVRILANMKDLPRRLLTALFFIWAGVAIFLVAEPFAESLVETGAQLGVSQFLLVQWLAPLASESPEFIIAITWALRGNGQSAIKALISSKVNQWTLLIGTIPLVFAVSSGTFWHPFELDGVQVHELVLTAAQSIFAVGILINMSLHKWEGVMLVVLFTAQLVVSEIRLEVTVVYIVLALVFHWLHRKDLLPAMRMGLGLKSKSGG